jgi:hypothetical protein
MLSPRLARQGRRNSSLIMHSRQQLTSRLFTLALVSLTLIACGDDVRVPVGESPAFDVAEQSVSSPAAPASVAKLAGSAADMSTVAQPAASAPSPDAVIAPSMVIRNGSVTLEVDSLELAIAAVQQVATRYGGYVGNSSLSAAEYQWRSATIELKIPAARFDSALAGLQSVGTVESVSSTAEDVGEEFVDVSARVVNARRLEERMINLLATRAGKLEEVLAVERELARVREEIERYTGRIRYLQSRVAISTLTVTVHEPAPLVSPSAGDNVLSNAFRDAWRNFVSFVAGFIALLGIIIPTLVLLVIGVWGWRKLRVRDSKAPRD